VRRGGEEDATSVLVAEHLENFTESVAGVV
jgi:hypothetical protein